MRIHQVHICPEIMPTGTIDAEECAHAADQQDIMTWMLLQNGLQCHSMRTTDAVCATIWRCWRLLKHRGWLRWMLPLHSMRLVLMR